MVRLAINRSQQHTHIILPQMDAFCAHCDGDIDAVIDQQGNPVRLGDLVQPPGSCDLDRRVAFLISVLDRCDPYKG